MLWAYLPTKANDNYTSHCIIWDSLPLLRYQNDYKKLALGRTIAEAEHRQEGSNASQKGEMLQNTSQDIVCTFHWRHAAPSAKALWSFRVLSDSLLSLDDWVASVSKNAFFLLQLPKKPCSFLPDDELATVINASPCWITITLFFWSWIWRQYIDPDGIECGCPPSPWLHMCSSPSTDFQSASSQWKTSGTSNSSDLSYRTLKTEFCSMNHHDSCTPLGQCRAQSPDKACKSWGQNILNQGDLTTEKSSKGDQVNSESDYL